MGRFDNLQKVPAGSEDFEFLSDLKGFSPMSGSGHLDKGNYEFEVTGIRMQDRAADRDYKSPGSKNIQFTTVSVGPDGSAGVPVVRVIPAPHDSDPKRTGEQMLNAVLYAIHAHAGTLATVTQGDKTTRKYKASWLKGKRFYASVRDGEGEYADRSEFDRYLTPEEYKAAPGPLARRVSPKQDVIPEIGTGKNGNGHKPASAAAQVQQAATEPTTGGDAVDDLMAME